MSDGNVPLPRFREPQDSFLYRLAQVEATMKAKRVRQVALEYDEASSSPSHQINTSYDGSEAIQDLEYMKGSAAWIILQG